MPSAIIPCNSPSCRRRRFRSDRGANGRSAEDVSGPVAGERSELASTRHGEVPDVRFIKSPALV